MFNYGSLNEFIGMLLFWAAGLYVLTRSPLESARTVGDLIVACMKKLEPGDGRPPPRPYPIPTGAYVEGRTTRELMNTYQIPQKSYYNERRKGVAAIAAELQSIARP